jgi:adenylate cyclase
LYLMARQFGRTGSERLKPLIVRLCKRAVSLDPDFGAAWAQLAFAEAEAAQRSVAGTSIEGARAAAQKAVEASPDLADAHAAMAEVIIRDADMDYVAAQPFIEAALRLDPNCYDAHLLAGYSAVAAKRWQDAIDHYEAAAAIDPAAYRPCGMVAQAYEALGDGDAVIANARRTIARCEALLTAEPDHGGAMGFLVGALVDLGEADRAREWTRRAVLFDPDNARLHYNLACGLAGLGDVAGACDLLDGIVDRITAGWFRWMEADNGLDGIRDDPRFKAILARGYARFTDEKEGQRA